jgi:hypothetical protein
MFGAESGEKFRYRVLIVGPSARPVGRVGKVAFEWFEEAFLGPETREEKEKEEEKC